MGGASVLRNFSRVVGAATAGAPISSAFCHVSAKPSVSSYDQKAPRCSCSVSAASPKEVLVGQAQADGWEAERIDGGYEDEHFVFGPVPTEIEVEEATQELQAAFHVGSGLTCDPAVEDGYTLVKSTRVLGGSRFNGRMEEPNEHLVSSTWIPYEPCTSQVALPPGKYSSVYQAFHLLQKNPQVQGAVMSLACDPAVWKAVTNNEKVKELIHSLDGDGDNSEAANDKGLFSDTYSCVKQTVSNVMAKFTNIISSIYDSFYSSLSRNKSVATYVMLAVAVTIVVLIKRNK